MINQTISNYLVRHEAVLQRLVADTEIPAERIRSAMLYSLFPGGKRLRPLLIYLCGEILDTQPDCLDIIAAAVELTHCYSLIHDDLPAMDNDDLRRGKPSCHKAFDEATAILVGDGMQALAIDMLLSYLPKSLNPLQVIEIARELVVASGPAGMVSGQSLDLSELANAAITESQLHLIHSLKTERLISACINMVIAASHSTEREATALRDFAKHLGFVFQIQDDYLDHYAKTDLLGKGRASDQANQKITFASLYSKEELHDLIDTHFQFAKDALIPLGEKAEDLLALTDYLHQRNNH